MEPDLKITSVAAIEGIDAEVINICDLLNELPGCVTFESCCGHLKEPFRVWFTCNDFSTLGLLARCTDRNYSDDNWRICAVNGDTDPLNNFMLESKLVFSDHNEMMDSVDSLCLNIRHWNLPRFDDYFKRKPISSDKLTGKPRMLTRLHELIESCSEKNWDGYGGHSLDEVAVQNTREIIEKSDDDVLDFFNLFPSPNATLSFESRPRVVCAMSVGKDGVSYAALKEMVGGRPEEKMKGTIKPFDVNEVVSKLKEIKEFFSDTDIKAAGALHLARKVAMNCDLRAIGSKSIPIFDKDALKKAIESGDLIIDWETPEFTKPKEE